MSTLDRKQPFGEIWGGTGQARYAQHGKYFDADGQEITSAAPSAPAPSAPAAAAAAVDPQEQARIEGEAAAAALAQRQAKLQMEAFKLLNLSVEKVVSELDDQSDEMLAVLANVEREVKQRQPVLEALAAEVKKRADKAAEEAARTDQVGAQLQ